MSHTDVQLADCRSKKKKKKSPRIPTHRANDARDPPRRKGKRTFFVEAGVSRHLRTRVAHFSGGSQLLRLARHPAEGVSRAGKRRPPPPPSP